MATFKKGSLLHADIETHHIFKQIAKNYLEESEVIHLAVKATFREYLLVTDKGVHIGKGQSFSDKRLHPIYQLAYQDLAAVQSQSAFLGLAYLMLKGHQPPLHQSSIFPVNWMLSLSGSFHFDEAARLINSLWSKWQADNPIPDRPQKSRKEPEKTIEPEITLEKTIKPEELPETEPDNTSGQGETPERELENASKQEETLEREPETTPDKFAEIRQYKALLDEGIIQEEEFEEMKKRLLA